MKSKLPYILGVLTLAVVIGVAVYSGQGQFFQGSLITSTKLATSANTTVTAEPLALDSTILSTRYNSALKQANLTATSLLPSIDMELTPVEPRHASGAQIKRAGPIWQLLGNSSSAPNGSYTLSKSYTSSVDLRIPTVQGSIYVLDCKIAPQNQAKAVFVRAGNKSYPAVEDGHAIYAFQASASSTDLIIAFDESPSTVLEGSTVGYFYGCSIDKT